MSQTLFKKSIAPTFILVGWFSPSAALPPNRQAQETLLVKINEGIEYLIVIWYSMSLHHSPPSAVSQRFHCWFVCCQCSHKSSSFYPGHPLPILSLLKLLLFHQHSCMIRQCFSIPPLYLILASACCRYFFLFGLDFFVLVNHQYACLFMVSLPVFQNTSFLCLQEVCSQRSDSALKLLCPSELHHTGSFLPLLNKSKSVSVKFRVCTLLAFLTSIRILNFSVSYILCCHKQREYVRAEHYMQNLL